MMATKQDIKPGQLLISTYGCTMRRANYWQVVDVIGTKVFLGKPKTSFKETSHDAGYAILIGPSENPEPIQRAKITAKGVKLCTERNNNPWRVDDHYWSYLHLAKAGDREYTYGD